MKIFHSIAILLLFTFLPLAELSAQAFAKWESLPDTLRADSIYYAGKDWYYDGNYVKARGHFEEALRLREGVLPPSDERIFKTYFWLGKAIQKQRYHQASLREFEKGLEIVLAAEGPESEWAADFYEGLAITYDQMYNLKKSNEYYDKCCTIYTRIYGPESRMAANCFMNIGYSQTKGRRYRESMANLEKALALFQKVSDPESEDFNRIYNNMGLLFQRTGNYARALEYAEKALKIKLLNYGQWHESVAKYYINLAESHAGLGDYEKALPSMQRAVEIYERSLGRDHPQTAGAIADMGHFYEAMGDSEKALSMFEDALAIQENRLDPTHPFVVSSYESIGYYYEDAGQYDKALPFYRQTLSKYLRHAFQVDNFVAIAHQNIAYAFIGLQQLDSAYYHAERGLEYLSEGYQYEPGAEPRFPDLESVESEIDLLDQLELKAIVLEKQFSDSRNLNALQHAYQTLDHLVGLIAKMRRSFQSDEARQQLNERVSAIFQSAVRVAYELHEQTGEQQYLLRALYFSELGKASILWKNFSENLALQRAGIPADELNALEQLGFQIQQMEEQVQTATTNEKSALKLQLFDLKRTYEKRIQNLEQFNPAYFSLKYALPELSLETLLDKIPNDETAVIEYFY
ncbi:MAG: tetratricopeptide repeat protein, partial [Bacteroidota bacterium]